MSHCCSHYLLTGDAFLKMCSWWENSEEVQLVQGSRSHHNFAAGSIQEFTIQAKVGSMVHPSGPLPCSGRNPSPPSAHCERNGVLPVSQELSYIPYIEVRMVPTEKDPAWHLDYIEVRGPACFVLQSSRKVSQSKGL